MSLISKTCFALRHFNRSVNKFHKPYLLNGFTRHTSSSSLVFRRFCHNNSDNNGSVNEDMNSSSKDIETIFLSPKVQTLLERLTGFDDKKIFAVKPSLQRTPNEFRFMTDKELNIMQEMARKSADEKRQMPPVMNPKEDKPKILSKDFEIQGYLSSNVVFVDSSSGFSDMNRLIVVREPNGILREANREERYRMNQIFFPIEERLIETPKMFFEPHLQAVLDRHDYEFVLDRACLQFEPNDPKYIEVCHKTYDHISANTLFAALRSTRHFGPMALYFAFNRKINNLLNYFILNEAITDGSDLVKLYYIIHSNCSQLLSDIDSETTDALELVKKYIKEESNGTPILELSLQKYEEIQREKLLELEDISKAHGITN